MNCENDNQWPTGKAVAVILAASAMVAITGLALSPLAVTLGLVLVTGAIVLGHLSRAYSLRTVILGTFLFCLYAGSRDFAYVGVRIGSEEMFIAEIVLGVLLLSVIPDMVKGLPTRRAAFPLALVMFWAIGCIALLRCISAYGLGAVRDSALCYYSLTYPLVVLVVSDEARLKALLWFCWAGWIGAGMVVFCKFLLGVGVPLDYDLFRYGAGAQALASISSVGWMIASCAPGTPRRIRIALTIVGIAHLCIGIFLIQHRSLFLATIGTSVVVAYCCIDKRWMITVAWLSAPLILILALTLMPSHTFNLPSIVVDTFARIESIVGHDDGNSVWRMEVWNRAVVYVFGHPLLGAGFGPSMGDMLAFGTSDRVDPHNSYVAILYRMGLPGLVTFTVLWVQVVGGAIARCRNCNSQRLTLCMALSSHMAAAIFAAFNVVLEGPYMGIPFWVSLALVHRASMRLDEDEGKRRNPLPRAGFATLDAAVSKKAI